MKKKSKLLIMKPLIVAMLLMLGLPAVAQHPLLNSDELDVYAFPMSTVTLGKQAHDEGRTCYKWTGCFPLGSTEMTGSQITFTLPETLDFGDECVYVLSVIGEKYYQQAVTLHVIDTITFTVVPKRGCFCGNESPIIDDFTINTDPPGFEEYVRLTRVRPHIENEAIIDGYYDVFFDLKYKGRVMSENNTTVINTDEVLNEGSLDFMQLDDFVDGIISLCKTLNKLNGFGTDGSATDTILIPINISIEGVTITDGFDCCDTIIKQVKIDVEELGVRGHLTIKHGIPIIVGVVPVARVGYRGDIFLELGARDFHLNWPKTCNSSQNEHPLYVTFNVSVGVFIEDITGFLLSATGAVGADFIAKNLKLKNTGYSLQSSGSAVVDLYVEYKIMYFSFFQVKGKLSAPNCPKEFPLDYDIIVF